jgi:hypothetical protein
LWDNIELFRGSLFYNEFGRRLYTGPTYKKEDLIIGQNELVTNSVINRLCDQLWSNLKTLINYFDPNYTFFKPIPIPVPVPPLVPVEPEIEDGSIVTFDNPPKLILTTASRITNSIATVTSLKVFDRPVFDDGTLVTFNVPPQQITTLTFPISVIETFANTFPNEGIVSINDRMLYFVTYTTNAFIVTGAKI